jgi:hypothetical protein
MNKFRNKWIFIIAILIVFLGIVMYSNRDDISKLIGISKKDTFNSNIYDSTTNNYFNVCKKKSNNIYGAALYNDSVSKGEDGYCVTGEENTCKGTTCYEDKSVGSCEAGTIILYRVNNDEIYAFNVLHDDGDTMTLQSMDVIASSAWYESRNGKYGPITALTSITEATKNWNNVNDLTYILGETIFLKYPNDSNNANYYTSCKTYNTCTTNYYSLSNDLTTNVKARIISVQEAVDLGCKTSTYSCPTWINRSKTNYWAINNYSESANAYIIDSNLTISGNKWVDSKYYLKAVIEINKWLKW